VLRWTISNPPCTASYDDVTITVYSALTPNAGPNTGYVWRSNVNCGTGYDTHVPMLNASASGGTSPYTYLWNNASYLSKTGVSDPENYPDPSAVPPTTTTFTVTVTDANGCTATDQVVVTSVDLCNISLGTGSCNPTFPARVEICCVSPCTTRCVRPELDETSTNSLTHHIAHGDRVGDCSGGCRLAAPPSEPEAPLSDYLHAIPNPFQDHVDLTFGVGDAGDAVLEVYNASGVKVAELFRGPADADVPYHARLDSEHLSQGIYFCRLRTASGNQLTQKLVLQR
jgi:hypothetical protein